MNYQVKINYHKKLHKIKKHWVIMAVSVFGTVGGGFLLSQQPTVHADVISSNANSQTSETTTSQSVSQTSETTTSQSVSQTSVTPVSQSVRQTSETTTSQSVSQTSVTQTSVTPVSQSVSQTSETTTSQSVSQTSVTPVSQSVSQTSETTTSQSVSQTSETTTSQSVSQTLKTSFTSIDSSVNSNIPQSKAFAVSMISSSQSIDLQKSFHSFYSDPDYPDSISNSSNYLSSLQLSNSSRIAAIFNSAERPHVFNSQISSIYDVQIKSANNNMYRVLNVSPTLLPDLRQNDFYTFPDSSFSQIYGTPPSSVSKPSSYIQVGNQQLQYEIGTPSYSSLHSGDDSDGSIMSELTPGYYINGQFYLYNNGNGVSKPLLFQLNNGTNNMVNNVWTYNRDPGGPTNLKIWDSTSSVGNAQANGVLGVRFSVDVPLNNTTYTFDGIMTMRPIGYGRVESTIQLKNVSGVMAPKLTIGQAYDIALTSQDDTGTVYATGHNQGLYIKGTIPSDKGYQLNYDFNTKDSPTGWGIGNILDSNSDFSHAGIADGNSLGQKTSDDASALPPGAVAWLGAGGDDYSKGDSGLFLVWKGQDLAPNQTRTISWVGRIKSPDSPDIDYKTDTKTITRTYNFIDAVSRQPLSTPIVQTVTFQRTAIYNADNNTLLGYNDRNNDDQVLPISQADSAWSPLTDTTVGNIIVPDLGNKGYVNPSTPTPEVINVNDSDKSIDLLYTHKTLVVTPDMNAQAGHTIPGVSAVFPSGVSRDDLYHKAVRTIQYQDDHGNPVAPTVTQSVTLTRNVIIDEATGQIVGYVKPNTTNIQSNSDTAWTPIDANNSQWSAVTSPDLTPLGYTAPDVGSVPVTPINSTASDVSVTVTYHHQLAILDHTNHMTIGSNINAQGNAKWPSGIDDASLLHQVHRQINVIDQRNHNLVAPLTQFAQFNRYAIVDKVTGQLLGYSSSASAQNIIPVSQGDKAWSPQSKQFNAVSLPDLSTSGYINPASLSVPTVTVQATDNTDYPALTFVYKDGLTTVTADSAQVPGQHINPVGNTVWPMGVDRASLYSDYQRSIQYVDAEVPQFQVAPTVYQDVHFNRTAIVDKVTGQLLGYSSDGSTNVKPNFDGWDSEAKTLPTILTPQLTNYGYLPVQPQVNSLTIHPLQNGNDKIVISYPHQIIDITANDNKHQGEIIDSNNPNQIRFLDDVSAKALTDNNTRTINFVDANTGKPITNSVVQTIVYHRIAMVDKVTGQLVGYDVNHDGKIDVTPEKGIDAWRTTQNPNFQSVSVPSFLSRGYISPYDTVSLAASYPEQNLVVNVPYTHQDVFITDASQFKALPIPMTSIPLTENSTRTINYLDNTTGKAILSPVIQTVTYRRIPVVDEVTGKIIGWSLNNLRRIDISADDPNQWFTDDDQWTKVVSPDLSSQGYATPNAAEVMAQSINPGDKDVNININYGHQFSLVDVNDKSYPIGITKADLQKDLIRTISYVDQTSHHSIAPEVIEKVSYFRNPIVDNVTHQIVGYSLNHSRMPSLGVTQGDEAWYTNDNKWEGIDSPILNTYYRPNPYRIHHMLVAPDQHDVHVTVSYLKHLVRSGKPNIMAHSGVNKSMANQTLPSKITNVSQASYSDKGPSSSAGTKVADLAQPHVAASVANRYRSIQSSASAITSLPSSTYSAMLSDTSTDFDGLELSDYPINFATNDYHIGLSSQTDNHFNSKRPSSSDNNNISRIATYDNNNNNNNLVGAQSETPLALSSNNNTSGQPVDYAHRLYSGQHLSPLQFAAVQHGINHIDNTHGDLSQLPQTSQSNDMSIQLLGLIFVLLSQLGIVGVVLKSRKSR